jgi:type I restriction enzyme S subunit
MEIEFEKRMKKILKQNLLEGKLGDIESQGQWKVKKLEKIADIHDNKRVPLSEMERNKMKGQYPYCGANGVIDYVNKYIYDGEYILLAEDGGAYGKYENSAYLMSGKFWVNNHAHIIQAKKEISTNQFMLYMLNYSDLNHSIVGSTRQKLNQDSMRRIGIPLPPLPEQRKITEILSAVDDAIEKINQKIGKFKHLKTGLMQKLLTGEWRLENRGWMKEKCFKDTEIGSISKDWNIKNLGEIGKFQYGYTTSAESFNTGIMFLRITDITDDGRIKWEKVPYCSIENEDFNKYKLEKDDILFARIGATAGKTAYMDKDIKGIFASYLIRFKALKNVLPKYIFHFTQSKEYWSQALKQREGQLKKGLNANVLSHIKIALSPSLEEQQKIAEILSTVDKKVEQEKNRKQKLKQVKKYMMDMLLTGKKRVKT